LAIALVAAYNGYSARQRDGGPIFGASVKAGLPDAQAAGLLKKLK
jgi:hypothetical protein